MKPEVWEKIKEIFLEAVDMKPARRAAYLSENCGADAELRAEIERMLAQSEEAENLMSRPAIERTALQLVAGSAVPSDDSLTGTTLGAYRLLKEIGRGGMGAVYLAERADGTFRRKVAVKIIKGGLETDFLLKRFRTERRVLAALDHPFIAQLYDGGTSADGAPYFVMEYVAGEPLYRFCDRRKLKVEERLKLFLKICRAVYAAHRLKIVHRDLKPSNVLIKPNGMPKLLDFGIAKLLDPDLAELTVEQTATALRMMTPEYASPEQVRGDVVSPASDVYSLGVILYELLTGHRPYRLKDRSPQEIARAVCENSPAKLSDSLGRGELMLDSGETGTLEKILEARNTNLAELQRALSGELERIVMKALHKIADERYQNALQLASDLKHLLDNEPAEKFAAPVAAMVKSSPGKSDKRSLAVLPLKIIGLPKTDEKYLSFGLADSLITRLSRLQRLSVRPTSSILRFADAEDPFAAGSDLNVEFVVDGNIRFAGEKIRVTIQLLSVSERSTHWSESFDEQFTDVLAVEDTVSERVAIALVPHLTAAEKQTLARRETNSSEAYESYLKGRFYWNQFTPDSLPKALEAFQTAVRLDPNYALARVGIADFYIWANIYGLISSKEALAAAEQYALEAVNADPYAGEAYATLSFVRQSRREWREAERLKLKAIELAPGYVHAHEWFADQLIATGRIDEGISEALIAERLAPLALRTKLMVSFAFYQSHRFEESLVRGQQILDLDKNYPSGYSACGIALWGLGRYAEALEQFLQFNRMIPDSPYGKYQLCHAFAKAGQLDQARKTLEEMKALAVSGFVKPFFLAMGHAAVGETDAAFALFERSFKDDDPWMLWFGSEPMLEELRSDPRYADLLRRLNNPLADNLSPANFAEGLADSDTKPRDNGQKSVAVLPLQMIGDEKAEDKYLGVGLADAIITRLSNVRLLAVRPTGSVLRFAGTADEFEAGRRLGVDYLLSGTIRRAGRRVRVSAQFLEVESRRTVWAEKFDEDLTGVLELEDAISERVVNLLIPQLTGEEQQKLKKRATRSPAAYEEYLRGRYHLYQLTPAALAESKRHFEKAVALDPTYALAFVGLAEYYFAFGAFAPVPPTETYAQIRQMAERALEIDDSLGEAYAILGYSFFGEFDFRQVEENLLRGVGLSPSYAPARIWLSILYTYQKRADEAIAQARRAMEVNPLGAFEQIHYSWILYQNRRFEEALDAARRTIAENPQYSHGLGFLSAMLRNTGYAWESVETASQAVQLSGENPWQLCNLAASLAAAGEKEEARRILRRLEANSREVHISPARLATAYTKLGDYDRALDELENAFAARDPLYVWISTDPGIDPLRSHLRFVELERRIRNYSK